MRISDWSSDVCSSDLIAAPLGLSVEEAAYGILRIANSNMARAVRAVSTERGYDIRKFALCAFGGAGGLHAAELARDCGIATLLIPQEPGTMRSEEHTSELQSLMRNSYAVFCLKQQKTTPHKQPS